jgi:hypothetical protein
MKRNKLCKNEGCEVEFPSMPLAKIILGLLEVEDPPHIPPLPYGVSQIVTFDIVNVCDWDKASMKKHVITI